MTVVVVVWMTAPATLSATGDDCDAPKVRNAPPYFATIWYEPAASDEVVNVAVEDPTPDTVSEPVPIAVSDPSEPTVLNVTVPVGPPVPVAAVTVAVIVTGWFSATFEWSSDSAVVVETIAALAGSAKRSDAATATTSPRRSPGSRRRRPVMRVAAGITWGQR